MRVLPNNIRDLLKGPIGELVNEKKLLDLLLKEKNIVSVGDQVTYTILKHGIKPVFWVVDYKTRRGSCSSDVVDLIKSFGDKNIVVDNPAGCISDALWDAVKSAYETQISNTKKFIKGKPSEEQVKIDKMVKASLDTELLGGEEKWSIYIRNSRKGN